MTASTIKTLLLLIFVLCFFRWVSFVNANMDNLQKAVEEIEKRTAQNKAHICNLHREMD